MNHPNYSVRDISMQIKGLEDYRNAFVASVNKTYEGQELGLLSDPILMFINTMDKHIDALVKNRKSLTEQIKRKRNAEMKSAFYSDFKQRIDNLE